MRQIYILSVSIVTILLAGCVQNHSQQSNHVSADGSFLRVGVSTNAPPLIYRNKNNIVGLEAELAAGLAKFMGKKVRFVPVKWSNQIDALNKGTTDIIMSGMTVTPARKYQVSFTKPYLFTGQISLVRRKEYNRFSNGLSDLLNPGFRVGTVQATTGDYLIEQNKAKGKRTVYKTSLAGVQALIEGEIDAFVYDMPGNLHYGSMYANKGLMPVLVPMTREQIAWAVRSNDAETLSKANLYLDSIKKSGELQRLVEKWIPYYKNVYNQ